MTNTNDMDTDRVTRRRTLKGLGVGVGLATLGGSGVGSAAASTGNNSNTPNEQWSQFQQNPANTGHGPSGGPRDATTLKWRFPADHRFQAPPLVADGMVYCGNLNGTFYAWEEGSGDVAWTHSTKNENRIEAAGAVADGTVYYNDVRGNVYALDESGNQKWHLHRDGATNGAKAYVSGSGVSLANGTLYVPFDHEMVAVDTDSGEVIWNYATDTSYYDFNFTPAVANATLFGAIWKNKNYALDAETGEELWVQDYGNETAEPTVKDGIVYQPNNNTLLKLDAETGQKASDGTFYKDNNIGSSPAVVDGVIYGSSQNSVFAVEAATGDVIWKHTTDDFNFFKSTASPAVTRGIVYIGQFAFDAETGELVYRFPRRGGGSSLNYYKRMSESSPAVANGTVYFGGFTQFHAIETDPFPSRLDIDINPDSDDNQVDFQDDTISVAILQTDEFDPTSKSERYRFGEPDVVKEGGGAEHESGHIEDVNGDGQDDLVLNFPTEDTSLDSADHRGRVEWDRDKTGKGGLSGTGVISIEDWPQQQFDAANTGTLPTRSGPRNEVTVKWADRTHQLFEGHTVVSDGMVYAGNWSPKFYAWDAETGEREWTHEPEVAIRSAAAVDDNTVYYGDGQANLYALDARTGEEKWHIKRGGPTHGVTLNKGTLFVAFGDDIVAVDADNGDVLWRFSTGSWNYAASVKNGKVFIGPQSKYALDAETGEQIWKQSYSGASTSTTVVEGTVYIGSGKSYFSYDAETGEKEFDGRSLYNDGNQIAASPIVVDGVLYGGSSKSVFAVDVETGEPNWKHTNGAHGFNGTSADPALVDGILYMGDTDGRMFGFDAETGEPLFDSSLGGAVIAAPAVANGNIFVGTTIRTDWITGHAAGRKTMFALEDPTQ